MTTVDLTFTQAHDDAQPVSLTLGALDDATPVFLLLHQEPVTGATVDLIFGAEDAPVITDTTGDLLANLPQLTAAITIRAVDAGTLTGAFAGPTLTASAAYHSNAQRPIVGKTAAPWQVAADHEAGAKVTHDDARAQPTGWGTPWQEAQPLKTGAGTGFVGSTRSGLQIAGTFQQGTRAWATTGTSFSDALRTYRQHLRGLFKDGQRLRPDTPAARHQDGIRLRRGGVGLWQVATTARKAYGGRFQTGTDMRRGYGARAQEGVPPPPGIEVVVKPVKPSDKCYQTPDALAANLVFTGAIATDTALVFVCERGGVTPPTKQPVIVPVKRVYIVLNTATLLRASDDAVIPTFALSLSIDVNSWAWNFSASIPASARALVQASQPVELKAMVNGAQYRLIAERIAQDRSFGDARVRISGRGKNAVLDAPYAPVLSFANTQPRTAQQLMNDVLMDNGVPIGWAVDWGITDWLVPTGAWSHQGSYMDALKAIAAAAGAYIAPHPTDDTVRVRHPYPTAPWDWGALTPDFVLPPDVVVQEGMEWVSKPAYNRVYVSGQGAGVLGRVTIDGTAGDLLAPMVVDPLITHADAARQRATAILGDTGRQAVLSLRLPVLASTGIIEPGAFVQYSDGAATHRGLVRATAVQVGLPEIWQTLEVQSHVA